MEYYNECILVNSIGTAALRANRQFKAGRKVVKLHQNVLVFLKGDVHKIKLDKYNYKLEGVDDNGTT